MITPDDGKIFFQLDWFRMSVVRQAIDDYWEGLPQTAGQQEDDNGSYTTTTSSSYISSTIASDHEQLRADPYATHDLQRGVHEICINYPACTRSS